MKLLVKAAGNSSIAETLEPVRSRGGKMLQVDRNMWLSKPGLRKPIPISPRQRLSGQAAIGDIAATNYAGDYQATLLREDQHAGEDCHVLELRATSNRTTYDRLNYWVSRDTGLALYAEFLSLSGKVLKTAEFEYANSIQVDQRSVPFVSRMIIRDALTDAVTVLQYSDVRVQRIGASEFAVSGMD